MCLGVNIGDAPSFVDRPTLDRIEVIDRAERPVRSADGDQLLERRLNVAGLVGAAALQDGGLAIPHPRIGEADGADRLRHDIELRRPPTLAAIDRYVD